MSLQSTGRPNDTQWLVPEHHSPCRLKAILFEDRNVTCCCRPKPFQFVRRVKQHYQLLKSLGLWKEGKAPVWLITLTMARSPRSSLRRFPTSVICTDQTAMRCGGRTDNLSKARDHHLRPTERKGGVLLLRDMLRSPAETRGLTPNKSF